MDGLVKFARAGSHRRGKLIRSSDYPKKGYILTLLPHSPATRWTCRAKEANCVRVNSEAHGSASFEQERREGEAAELVGPGIHPSPSGIPLSLPSPDVCGASNIQRTAPAPNSKTQFNGVGALRTYISLTHSSFQCKAGIWRTSVHNDFRGFA
jgi:hypothetical protein